MSETLKPCPKCGSTDVVAGFHGDEDGGYGYAECRHAEMSDGHFCGVHADDEEEAIRIWNTRPTPGEDKPLGIEEVVELARKAKPLLDCDHRANRPNDRVPGERIVGFVMGEDDIGLGLSEPLFALEALVKLARAAAYEQALESTPPPLGV